MSYIQKNKAFIILVALLFISVTLNVFSLGTYFGRHMNVEHNTQNSDSMSSSDVSHAAYIKQADKELRQALPEADKKILRKIMQEYRPKLKEKKNTLRDIRKKRRQMMKSKIFDKEQMHNLMTQEKQAREDLFSSLNQAKLTAMENMSPQGREALSKIDMTHFSRKNKDRHSHIGNEQTDQKRDGRRNRQEITKERREHLLKKRHDRDAY